MIIEDLEDIKNLISQCENNHSVLHLKEFADITKELGDVNIGLDEDCESLMYYIPTKSMIGKDITNSIITNRKWLLSDDETYIFMKIE